MTSLIEQFGETKVKARFLKLERGLFYLLIFFIPLQLRKITAVWVLPTASGFNEWNSAFLYGTDILVGLLLICGLIRSGGKIKIPVGKRWSKASGMLAIFLGLAALSLIKADNLNLGLYRWLKLAEFAGLFYYVSQSVGHIFRYAVTLKLIMISGVWQAAWGMAQSFKQSSLGLVWLGESVLRTNFAGVAVVSAEGEKFLRAYGSFPHPNVLAAWLFLAIFSFYFWYLYHHKDQPFWLVVLLYAPLLWGLMFTFSRVIIGLWLLGIVLQLGAALIGRKRYNFSPLFIKRIGTLVLISTIVLGAFISGYWPVVKTRWQISANDQALTARVAYNKIAGEVTKDHPWLGVGLGQFVGEMQGRAPGHPAYFYQPVHNIFLLISSELGVAGLMTFLLFVFFLIYRYVVATGLKAFGHLSFLILSASVLGMGLFDHFLWTSQQGQLLLWLMLALAHSGRYLQKKVI